MLALSLSLACLGFLLSPVLAEEPPAFASTDSLRLETWFSQSSLPSSPLNQETLNQKTLNQNMHALFSETSKSFGFTALLKLPAPLLAQASNTNPRNSFGSGVSDRSDRSDNSDSSGDSENSAEQSRPGTVLKMEAFEIEGRIQKPEAFYILPRSKLTFEGLEREQSFLPRVRKSLEKPPLRLD